MHVHDLESDVYDMNIFGMFFSENSSISKLSKAKIFHERELDTVITTRLN